MWACAEIARKAFRLVMVVPGGVALSLAGAAIAGGREVAWPQVRACMSLNVYRVQHIYPQHSQDKFHTMRYCRSLVLGSFAWEESSVDFTRFLVV